MVEKQPVAERLPGLVFQLQRRTSHQRRGLPASRDRGGDALMTTATDVTTGRPGAIVISYTELDTFKQCPLGAHSTNPSSVMSSVGRSPRTSARPPGAAPCGTRSSTRTIPP